LHALHCIARIALHCTHCTANMQRRNDEDPAMVTPVLNLSPFCHKFPKSPAKCDHIFALSSKRDI
jgi:hypothetical protein